MISQFHLLLYDTTFGMHMHTVTVSFKCFKKLVLIENVVLSYI